MRRTMGLAAASALTLVLAGCDAPGGGSADDAVAVEILPGAAPALPQAGSTSAPAGEPAQAARPVQAASIAYVYRYGLELPVEQAGDLMSRHEQACISAGPAACQVIGSQSNRHGRDQLSAQLEIRATPAFLAIFRARLASEAESAGGRVASAATSSEDLTRSLIDTEAKMSALTTLRDRLQQLLATRSASLDQLLATERELARVQGELDATRSALEVMRARVATSRLIIDYQAAGQLAPDSAFRPVRDALDNALTVFMGMVAALILFVAGALPVVLLGAPLVWLLVRWRERRGRSRLARAATRVTPASVDPDPDQPPRTRRP